jgi:hypothetical protein
MSRQLTTASTLENLKREAKRWLKALRAKDDGARTRLERAHPSAPAQPALRDVQHALAREHGFEGWTALTQSVQKLRGDVVIAHDRAELAAWFVQNACPDHSVRGGRAHLWAVQTASRILEKHPEVARDSFQTAIITGDVEEVARRLRERPQLAGEKGGPKGWEPLLYLAFTRLPLAAVRDNAVAIARSLLDHGADPNAHFMAGDSVYTPFVGVVGEGEEDRPAHPRRDELARLLLERDAEPYDIQVLYNIHFHGDALWFMSLIHEHAVRRGRARDWDDPSWRMLDMGGYGTGARYLLSMAIQHNDLALARWLLEHGADPNAPPARGKRLSKRSLYADASVKGLGEMAELLRRFGARIEAAVLTDEEQFAAACVGDLALARELLRRHQEFLRSPRAMALAIEHDRVDAVRFLLDAGMSPDIPDPENGNQRPLHVAAFRDSPDSAALLIERGAEIDAKENTHDATPIGFASYGQKARMIDLLSLVSTNVWVLTLEGKVDRLREVLRAEPTRARVQEDGWTPLMWLPADETRALEIATLLLAHGADPRSRNGDGDTAADIARRRALDNVTDLLDASIRA